MYPAEREKDTLAWWEEYANYLRSIKKDIYLIAEVWVRPQKVAPYTKKFDSCFNFPLAQSVINSILYQDSTYLQDTKKSMESIYKKYNSSFYTDAIFLTNHDMNRVYSVLIDKTKMKLAATLLLTLPVNPYIYYGEEIVMKGQKPDEYIIEPFK
ncbi:alpha-amylase family glycosyl hydrolase [Caldicellulosiruptor saccharolyticus]|uniref:alpha-amylase family glycosyl hydrolase n=1 Tax=Caldicellulosiruptor saccharolyticus TaxID=44001 RepID=UPI000A07249C|nr:alpha-amylase family glycosyl hydrolase [Caldicellulosiruptor saccharolyticus]